MLLPVAFAGLDLLGAKMWRTLGGFGAEAYVIAEPAYMVLFWTFAYLMILAIAATHYFIKKDKSEALALGIIPFILLQFGVEDVFFYLFGGHEFWTATMPWLTENLWAPTLIGRAAGFEIITGPVLFVSALIGVLVSVKVADYLQKNY